MNDAPTLPTPAVPEALTEREAVCAFLLQEGTKLQNIDDKMMGVTLSGILFALAAQIGAGAHVASGVPTRKGEEHGGYRGLLVSRVLICFDVRQLPDVCTVWGCGRRVTHYLIAEVEGDDNDESSAVFTFCERHALKTVREAQEGELDGG